MSPGVLQAGSTFRSSTEWASLPDEKGRRSDASPRRVAPIASKPSKHEANRATSLNGEALSDPLRSSLQSAAEQSTRACMTSTKAVQPAASWTTIGPSRRESRVLLFSFQAMCY